jgi:hypothetical protein
VDKNSGEIVKMGTSKNASLFGNVKDLKNCYNKLTVYLFEKYTNTTVRNYEKKDLISLAYYQGVMGRID